MGLPHEGIIRTGLSHFERDLPYITLWRKSWEPVHRKVENQMENGVTPSY